MPHFQNRPNPRVDLPDGRAIYHSRSVAIAAVTIAYSAAEKSFYALVGQRGPAVDFEGLWCLTCGYLDWDESLEDAVRREVFEEADLDLKALEARGVATLWRHPLYLQSDPTVHLQNITARFLVSLDALVPPSTKNAEAGEVQRVEWMPLNTADIAERAWAFHHELILSDLAAFFAEEKAQGTLGQESAGRFYRACLARLA